jgi:hypothetical protein
MLLSGVMSLEATPAKRGDAEPGHPSSASSSGNQPSIQNPADGPDTRPVRDEDWKFDSLIRESRPVLVAACWYEYARESLRARDIARRWLELRRVRAELRPLVQDIFKQAAENRKLLHAQPAPISITVENYMSIAENEISTRAFCRDPALPRELSDRYCDLHSAEHEMQQIESRAGVGAPRLRVLAHHLAVDQPWLLIPAEDRRDAVQSAFVSRFEVPKSEAQMTHFRALLAFEPIHWSDLNPPQFTDEQVRKNEDLFHRQITVATPGEKRFP